MDLDMMLGGIALCMIVDGLILGATFSHGLRQRRTGKLTTEWERQPALD